MKFGANEIHYDNMTPDGNEKIEIAGASGTNLAVVYLFVRWYYIQ